VARLKQIETLGEGGEGGEQRRSPKQGKIRKRRTELKQKNLVMAAILNRSIREPLLEQYEGTSGKGGERPREQSP